MNVSLLGPTGVGKGTHALELGQRFSLLHAASGDLFRASLKGQTALGLLARRYLEQGELVPDELVDAMMEEWLRKASPARGVLFDGFPRTAYQARFLDELFPQLNRRLDVAIYLRVSDDVILRRLTGRWLCIECQAVYHEESHPPKQAGRCDHCNGVLYRRPDDVPEIVQARLRTFHRTTGPVLEHYQADGRLIILEGEGKREQVLGALVATLNHVLRGEVPPALLASAADLAELKPITAEAVAKARPSLDLVLLGGPGSGKGTQAGHLSEELDLPHIATGDLFREHLKNQTELGKVARTYMDRGELVPDDVTEAMVQERLSQPDARDGFILDGFPRTVPQAEALADMLVQLRRHLEGVLYINVSDQEIVNRLGGRLICRECQTPFHRKFKPPQLGGRCDACGGLLYQRDDDQPATIQARLKTFHGQTEPLIEHYRKAGLLHEIDGEGELDEVGDRTLAKARSLAG